MIKQLKRPRDSVQLANVMSAIFVATVFVGVGIALWWWFTPAALPPLADALPVESKAAAAMFRVRIAEKFVVGSPEADLIKELSAQRFTRTANDGAMNVTIFERPRFPCRRIWSVRWRADENGRLMTTDADYSERLCL